MLFFIRLTIPIGYCVFKSLLFTTQTLLTSTYRIKPHDTQLTPVLCYNLEQIFPQSPINLQIPSLISQILVQNEPHAIDIDSKEIQVPSLIEDKSNLSDQYSDPVVPISLIDVSSIVAPSIYIPPVFPEPQYITLPRKVLKTDSKSQLSEIPSKSLSESQIPEKRSQLKSNPFENSPEPQKTTIFSGAAKMIGKTNQDSAGSLPPPPKSISSIT
ncbi:hypothetical protein MXB_4522, partial [Myxobolus squamalis]